MADRVVPNLDTKLKNGHGYKNPVGKNERRRRTSAYESLCYLCVTTYTHSEVEGPDFSRGFASIAGLGTFFLSTGTGTGT